MSKVKSGFTLVELLVVIVVIAILAAITIVAYNGIQEKAHNSSREAELMAYIKAFTLYKTENGAYPSMPSGNYCLGGHFPIGYNNEPRCWAYASEGYSIPASTNGPLMDALHTVAQISDGDRTPVNGNVGPWVSYTTSGGQVVVQIIGVMAGTDSSVCPSQAPELWSDGNGLVMCSATLN